MAGEKYERGVVIMNSTNPHDILGFVCPTNEPEVALRFLLASIENLKEVAPISTFLFNFQQPWTEEQTHKAVDICKSNGFEVRFTFNSYTIKGKGLIPFNRIRADAAKLMPEAKFFALTDDDFAYQGRSGSYWKSAGEQYIDLIYYMMKYPRCGFILMKGRFYLNDIEKYNIAPTPALDNRYITDKGILARNFSPAEGLLIPDSALDLLGSDEEKIICSWRLYNGFYPAAINRAKTLHYEHNNTKDSAKKISSGEEMYAWNEKSILDDNVNKFIRENYCPDFYNKGGRVSKIVDYEAYYVAGGINLEDSNIRENHTMDTSKLNSISLINEIIDYYCKDKLDF